MSGRPLGRQRRHGVVGADDDGEQMIGLPVAVDGQHGAVRHARHRAQARLDLLELEAIPVQLDLVVQPAGAGERAVRRIDRPEVAGAIGAAAVGEREEGARPVSVFALSGGRR